MSCGCFEAHAFLNVRKTRREEEKKAMQNTNILDKWALDKDSDYRNSICQAVSQKIENFQNLRITQGKGNFSFVQSETLFKKASFS